LMTRRAKQRLRLGAVILSLLLITGGYLLRRENRSAQAAPERPATEALPYKTPPTPSEATDSGGTPLEALPINTRQTIIAQQAEDDARFHADDAAARSYRDGLKRRALLERAGRIAGTAVMP
jgi:hypothetical protein